MGKTWSAGRIIIDFPEGHPQHGLEVVMRRRRIREVLDDLTVPPPKSREELAELSGEEQQAYVAQLTANAVGELIELVVDWNFAVPVKDEKTGAWVDKPQPVSIESAMLMDDDTFNAIQDAYRLATTRVAPPLPEPSDAGEPSEEALMLPQEPL